MSLILNPIAVLNSWLDTLPIFMLKENKTQSYNHMRVT